jgi:hypothetical protein
MSSFKSIYKERIAELKRLIKEKRNQIKTLDPVDFSASIESLNDLIERMQEEIEALQKEIE